MTLKAALVRTRLAVLGIFFGAALMFGGVHFGIALADPALPPSSPAVTASQTIESGWDLIAQYGPIWGVALLLSGGVALFLKKNESQHWLAQGRALAIVTALGMLLAALTEWHFGGGQGAGVVVTLIGVVKLLWSPHGPADKPAGAA